VGPEEGHENYLRDGTLLLCGQGETVMFVQPGEEEAPGRSYCGLPVLQRGL